MTATVRGRTRGAQQAWPRRGNAPPALVQRRLRRRAVPLVQSSLCRSEIDPCTGGRPSTSSPAGSLRPPEGVIFELDLNETVRDVFARHGAAILGNDVLGQHEKLSVMQGGVDVLSDSCSSLQYNYDERRKLAVVRLVAEGEGGVAPTAQRSYSKHPTRTGSAQRCCTAAPARRGATVPSTTAASTGCLVSPRARSGR